MLERTSLLFCYSRFSYLYLCVLIGQGSNRRGEEESQESRARAQKTRGPRECREKEAFRSHAREKAQAQALDHEQGH